MQRRDFLKEMGAGTAFGLMGSGGPTVVLSFADGVAGYLMPQDDLDEGGYESTWTLPAPESVSRLRTTALKLIR